MWLIAFKTLLSDRGKLLTALVGVTFSIVLVNVQGGLFLGMIRKASLLVDRSDADVWVGHKMMNNVDFPQDIPRRWVHQIRVIPGVAEAEPYTIGHSTMTLPDGGFETVTVVGSEPVSLLGSPWQMVDGRVEDLRSDGGIIVDVYEAEKLRDPQIGSLREIGGRRARIVGRSRGVVGFLVTPYVFTTLDRAAEYLRKPIDVCSYYLLRLKPGADAEAVCQLIRERVPELDAHTQAEYAWITVDYWLQRTGIGISFGAATLLGLLVGMVMVAQTLYASVLDRLGEFGTLKAVGACERHLLQILISQATAVAAMGAGIGLLIVKTIQSVASSPRAPIHVPLGLAAGSCVLVLVICWVASLLPYLRIRRIDPAMVLQT